MSGIYGIGQAFKSFFGLKDGGAVPERTFSFSKWKEALSKHPFAPLPTPIRRKCGGCVKKTKGKKKGKDKK